MSDSMTQEARYRAVFRRAHARHAACQDDEWLMQPCYLRDGTLADRPIVWSRRNGPWRQVDLLWVGAAPGNAGGKGAGLLGAHGTRIPFGGDVAGANLDALLGSIGATRNDTFISAALNRLPAAGGGEPTMQELRAAVGDFPSSVHLLRETVLAAGPRLVVALGNVALRSILAAVRLAGAGVRLPTLERLRQAGLQRGGTRPMTEVAPPDADFERLWRDAWGARPLPAVLWLTHPSAQNMSPFAGRGTLFHTRMLDARDALRAAARQWLDCTIPPERPKLPVTGIYALTEWRELVAPRHARLDALWRERDV